MKNIYVSLHLPSHGIGFTKNILAAFYNGLVRNDGKEISTESVEQITAEEIWDNTQKPATVFDKVYYLYCDQGIFDKITKRRPGHHRNEINDDDYLKAKGLTEIWLDIFDKLQQQQFSYDYFKTLIASRKFKSREKDILGTTWRHIHCFPIQEQIKWFLNDSNISPSGYKNRNQIEFINLSEKYNLTDLRDYKQVPQKMKSAIEDINAINKNANYFINISLGTNETQVSWFLLAEKGILPLNTRFIQAFDNKDDVSHARFKDFIIREVPTNLLEVLSTEISIFKQTKSKSRKLVQTKFNAYLRQGFSILLIGERGTGKTDIARFDETDKERKIVHVNCASFEDSNMAESQLFGYVKGAYTGGNPKGDDGYFQQAHNENGDTILFLDEIHHLKKGVQAKLMTALQTNSLGEFDGVKKMGATEKEKPMKFKLMVATNKTLDELKEILLPDFYDRIAQFVIEIPSLKDTPEDREDDWRSIWAQMKFGKKAEAPANKELIKWLKGLQLWGNYRDLQKIAIYYHTFLKFQEDKIELDVNTPLQFAQQQFDLYHSPAKDLNSADMFSDSITPYGMVSNYQKELALWAKKKFGSYKVACNYFNKGLTGKKDRITEKTFYNWENGS